jgi:predicted deacylase
MYRITNNDIQLKGGCVTFIPICNEKAYQQNERYCNKNLNRVFKCHPNPSCYEERVANELLPYVSQADYLLDLHSMPIQMRSVIYKRVPGKLSKNWQHLDLVQKGTLIAEYDNSKQIIADYDR